VARRIGKAVGVLLVTLAVAYGVLSAALYVVMHRPPAAIASVFRHVPWVFWGVLPMRPMWLQARAGGLEVGDAAPAFDLPTFDGRSRVSLASLRGKPAVLVFGSYT
jgi:hypothetical protein